MRSSLAGLLALAIMLVPSAAHAAPAAQGTTGTGGPGSNRYSGGAGNDQVSAANGRSERVDCGSGSRDIARVDAADRVSGCELVFRG